MLSLTFGGRQKQVTDKRANKDILNGNTIYQIDIYVLKDLTVPFILGNEFLDSNECLVNYKNRTLTIEKSNVIELHGATKTSEEILDEELSENHT